MAGYNPNAPATPKVHITDLEMPFWSMVCFMVKWAIASIPATIILVICGLILFVFTSGFVLAFLKAATR